MYLTTSTQTPLWKSSNHISIFFCIWQGWRGGDGGGGLEEEINAQGCSKCWRWGEWWESVLFSVVMCRFNVLTLWAILLIFPIAFKKQKSKKLTLIHIAHFCCIIHKACGTPESHRLCATVQYLPLIGQDMTQMWMRKVVIDVK